MQGFKIWLVNKTRDVTLIHRYLILRHVAVKTIIEKFQDYRLRPRLQKACQMDLKKFCSKVLLRSDKTDLTVDFLEGKVLKCLEAKFAESAELLTSPCRSTF